MGEAKYVEKMTEKVTELMTGIKPYIQERQQTYNWRQQNKTTKH